jgi:hypothetical protein
MLGPTRFARVPCEGYTAGMKAAAFVFLLAASGLAMGAQSAASSRDVTLWMNSGSPEYCLGPNAPRPHTWGGEILVARDPDDIPPRLPLKLRYENHRPETIFLPPWARNLLRVTVVAP